MDRYASLLERRRGVVAGFAVAFTLLSVWATSRLGFDDVPRGIFRAGGEDYARLEELFADFGSDDGDCVVVLEAEDWFSAERIDLLRRLLERLAAVEGVERTISIADVVAFDLGLVPVPLLPARGADADELRRARERALEHPLVVDQLLSRDGRTLPVVVGLREGLDAIHAIEPVVAGLRAAVADTVAGTDVRARLTGFPTIRVEVFRMVRRDNLVLVLAGSLVALGVAWLVFRRLSTFAPAAAAALLGGLWGTAAIHLTGGQMDILKTVLPCLMIIIGLTDAIHLVLDVRHRRGRGTALPTAAAQAVRQLGGACLLTSLTTATGFASLALARIEIVRSFGVASTAAVGLTFAAVLTVAPLLAGVIPQDGRRRPATRPGRVLLRAAHGAGARICARPGPTAAAGVAACLVCAVGALQLRPDNRITEVTPRHFESFRALRHMDAAFGGSMFAGVVVEWEPPLEAASPEVLAVLDAVARTVDAVPPFGGALSYADVLRTLPAGGRLASVRRLVPDHVERRFVRPELQRALVRARVPDVPSARAREGERELSAALAALEEASPGFRLHLTGTAIVARRNIDEMIADLALGLGLAAGVIFAVIALAMGSVRLGLISLLPNLFPLLFASAVLAWSGYELQMVSAVSLTILLAVAVDDTIHVLTRYRRELARGASVERAVRRSLRRVGAAVLATTAILLAGFAAIGFSEVPSNRTLSAVCSLGLAAALVGDLVFLPALLARCGRPTDADGRAAERRAVARLPAAQ